MGDGRIARRRTFLGAAYLIVIFLILLYKCVSESFFFWFILLTRMVLSGQGLSALLHIARVGMLDRTECRQVGIHLVSALSPIALAIFCAKYIVNEGPRVAFGVIQYFVVALKRETRDKICYEYFKFDF